MSAYDYELDEARDPRTEDGDCYPHHTYRRNKRGGGTCTHCGDTLDRDEL